MCSFRWGDGERSTVEAKKKCVNYWKSVGTLEKSSLMNSTTKTWTANQKTATQHRPRQDEEIQNIESIDFMYLILLSAALKRNKISLFFISATRQALKNYISLVRSCLFGLFYGVPLFFHGLCVTCFIFFGRFQISSTQLQLLLPIVARLSLAHLAFFLCLFNLEILFSIFASLLRSCLFIQVVDWLRSMWHRRHHHHHLLLPPIPKIIRYNV